MDFLKKNALLFVTFVGWAITAYSLFFIQFKMFDGAVKTVFAYFLIFVPCLVLTNFLNIDKKEIKNDLKLNPIAYVFALFAVFILCMISSPYIASIWNIVIIPIVGLILAIKKDLAEKLKDKTFVKERCIFVTAIFMLIVAQPLIFSGIADVKSINSAQDMLQGNTSYVARITNLDILGLKTDVLDANLELGSYMFTSDNDTATVVSVISGKILGTYNVSENSTLKSFVSYSTK